MKNQWTVANELLDNSKTLVVVLESLREVLKGSDYEHGITECIQTTKRLIAKAGGES